jgi:hypothetical protein
LITATTLVVLAQTARRVSPSSSVTSNWMTSPRA